ncbi:hypothetical protein PGTDC60_0009 [Porphyromonas gingivalis TDC60]|nr:hypothetical protein PGTDC60_0009 [Porphyromonas gingivalis TDC60]
MAREFFRFGSTSFYLPSQNEKFYARVFQDLRTTISVFSVRESSFQQTTDFDRSPMQ